LGFCSISFFSVATSLVKGIRIVTVGDYCLFSSTTGAVAKEAGGIFTVVFGNLSITFDGEGLGDVLYFYRPFLFGDLLCYFMLVTLYCSLLTLFSRRSVSLEVFKIFSISVFM
jgi:hypothetical protein